MVLLPRCRTQVFLIIDLVKDFTALYIIAVLDNYAFLAIKDGYFAHIFKDEIKSIKDTKIKERDYLISCLNKPVPTQSIAMFCKFSVMFGIWLSFLLKQKDGHFFKEVHSNCNIIDDEKSLNYLSWGDGTCDPKLFTEGCGLDGGDCNNKCTTYFQFYVPKPYLTTSMRYLYDSILFKQAYKEFNFIEDDDSSCDIPKDCEDSVEYHYTDFISNCFSDKTIYEIEEHLWWCWYGLDEITQAKVGKFIDS